MNTMRFTEKQRQWLWFAGLFVGGMAGMLVLAGLVRLMLGMENLIGHLVSAVTSDLIPFFISHRVIFDPETPVCGHPCQDGSGQCDPMTGTAAVFTPFVEVFMPAVSPVRIIDIVHAVGAVGGQSEAARRMTGRTFDNGAAMPLDLPGGHIVIGRGIGVGPDGVGAAVAGFTVDVSVAFAEPVKRISLFGKSSVSGLDGGGGFVPGQVGRGEPDAVGSQLHACTGEVIQGIPGVAGLAAGKIQPRFPVTAAAQMRILAAHGDHVPVAVDALHPGSFHGWPLALGDGS